ncbi:MAG: hypothetical protein OHK0052_09500 [Anaerolineales bacterium]
MLNIRQIHNAFAKKFRSSRMKAFIYNFRVSSDTRILDVGGSMFNWTLIDELPNLTMLNILPPKSTSSQANWMIADAKFLPFASASFDIVYSNSVIEHLSDYASQQKLAAECARVGKQYYVQTPNKWFPIEPHVLTLFIHWLPKKWQRYLIRYFSVWGWLNKPSLKQIDELLAEVRLLTKKEMQSLFPNGLIHEEKVFVFTKSFLAIKQNKPSE